jgi:hypothetical protein
MTASYGHTQALALGAAVLEPELHVLGFKFGELLAVGHAVEFFSVLEDEVVAGVSIVVEPLFQPRDFGYRVYEGSVTFTAFLRKGSVTHETPGEWGDLRGKDGELKNKWKTRRNLNPNRRDSGSTLGVSSSFLANCLYLSFVRNYFPNNSVLADSNNFL